MIRDNGEQHFKVLIRVQVVRFCSFYKAVDHCAGFRSMIGLDQHKVLPADRKGADGLLGRVVIHWDVAVIEEPSEVLLLVNAVTKGSSDRSVLCHLGIFQFGPLEIGINFLLKDKLTLFQAVFRWKVIEPVIQMEQFCDTIVCFLGDGSIGDFRIHGFDEIGEWTPCVDPASGDVQVFTLIVEGVIHLVSVRDDGT